MNCHTCGKPFTAEDEAEVNYSEWMGKYSHKMCPGTECVVCHEELDYTQAEHRPLSAYDWKHKDCKYIIKLEPTETIEADPSSWIAK